MFREVDYPFLDVRLRLCLASEVSEVKLDRQPFCPTTSFISCKHLIDNSDARLSNTSTDNNTPGGKPAITAR